MKGGLMTHVMPPNMKRMEMNSVKPQASFRNTRADRLQRIQTVGYREERRTGYKLSKERKLQAK